MYLHICMKQLSCSRMFMIFGHVDLCLLPCVGILEVLLILMGVKMLICQYYLSVVIFKPVI